MLYPAYELTDIEKGVKSISNVCDLELSDLLDNFLNQWVMVV